MFYLIITLTETLCTKYCPKDFMYFSTCHLSIDLEPRYFYHFYFTDKKT